MSESKKSRTTIFCSGQTYIVSTDEIPRTSVSVAHMPLEWLKKYSSPKPVFRPPPRRLKKRDSPPESTDS